MKMWLLTVVLSLFSFAPVAQDPLKVAPDAYKLEFENEWVKVTRVHYAAHARIPEHDHTESGAAYIYLNDSGPVIFRHIGLSYGAITRPETKAGSYRLYKAVKETHAVENPNDTPSDFLRVEFKTAQDDTKPLKGKFYREAFPQGENFQKVEFENGQILATRLICTKTEICDVSGSVGPVLIVSLTPAHFESSGGGARFSLEPGKTKWYPAGQKEVLKTLGPESAELLRFELKGKPLKGIPNEKPHRHE